MKNKVIKNLIAVLSFLIFVLFLVQKYYLNLENKKLVVSELKNVNEVEDETIIQEENTEVIKENDNILDSYYTNQNINLDRILSAKDNDIKKTLVSLLNRFAVSDLREIAGQERLDYIKLYDGMMIVGDSNIRHLDYYHILETDYYTPYAGKNLEYQANHVKEYVNEKTKKVIFWNGYNIAYYKDADEYVNDYQNLVDTVKKINSDIEVYVCSLMPATDMAIENDLKGEIVHNIYRGKEYDNALEKHFKDNYINIKFIGKQKYYGNDGIHFMPQFYYMFVPYLAYYLNLEYE